jgi:hypothetical protein
MIDIEALRKFLVKANENGYAGGAKEVTPQRPGFSEIEYKSGDWYFRDSYAGHYFAPGQEVVYFRDKPVWAMAYAGGMTFDKHGDTKLDKITYKFLRKALLAMDPDKPFRGPEHFDDGEFCYHSELEGDIEEFAGNEYIEYKGKVIFSQNFIGGLIVDK